MQYSFRFNEIAMNQVWFEAKDDEEAKSLMKQVMDDEININERGFNTRQNLLIYLISMNLRVM